MLALYCTASRKELVRSFHEEASRYQSFVSVATVVDCFVDEGVAAVIVADDAEEGRVGNSGGAVG